MINIKIGVKIVANNILARLFLYNFDVLNLIHKLINIMLKTFAVQNDSLMSQLDLWSQIANAQCCGAIKNVMNAKIVIKSGMEIFSLFPNIFLIPFPTYKIKNAYKGKNIIG